MFFAALVIIAELWKQPRCTKTDELIKKIEFYHLQINGTGEHDVK
jgi:hypothetical protein